MLIMDILLVAIVVIAAWYGYKEGLIRSLTSLLSTVVSLYAATLLYGTIGGWVAEVTGWRENVCRMLVFILLVIIFNRLVVFLLYLADRAFRAIMGLPVIRTINRALGAFCRGLETVIIIAIFIYLSHRFPISHLVNSWFDASFVAGLIVRFTGYLWPFMEGVIASF